METRTRTIVKSGVWTLLGLISMALVGLASTGSMALGGTMALANAAIGFVFYLAYERIWSKIDWGRNV